VGGLTYLGQDDYKAVLEYVADGKFAEAAEYEKLSGEKWVFPLPGKAHSKDPLTISKNI
jgi:thioredoxin-related protein